LQVYCSSALGGGDALVGTVPLHRGHMASKIARIGTIVRSLTLTGGTSVCRGDPLIFTVTTGSVGLAGAGAVVAPVVK
jgi:hypothetical protein